MYLVKIIKPLLKRFLYIPFKLKPKKNVPTVINNIVSMYIMVMKSSLFILYFLCILFALLIANYVLTFFVKEGMENAENNKDNGTVKKHTKKVKTHKF